jgi:hypothetical protein
MTKITLIIFLFSFAHTLMAVEYHVSANGKNSNKGSIVSPLKSISAAAKIAQPGDIITVHAGTYRERITPPRGGESDAKRITYKAAQGEEVWIKGSEIIDTWKHVKNGVWKTTLPNSFFGDYNPYKVLLEGDWLDSRGRIHHTGEVFLNQKSLYEKASRDEVMNPKPFADSRNPDFSIYTWYCESNDKKTTIWANFHSYNPNEEQVEINVRNSCFYPAAPGVNYITIRGFNFSQAATQWAAPTAEQRGLIGTHWSTGWIIEDNIISNSKCSGITLGKDRATGHNVWSNDRSKGGDVHYNEVIVRALQAGWTKGNIGSHIVRNNTIFDCEQTGMCGSMGAAFSTISNNHIYDIWTKRQFRGAETGAIKLHAPIDVLIENNHLHNAGRGLWMDWMTQGTHISGNLCYDNTIHDIFLEVNHGPYLVDNNICLSETALESWSEGGAYAHNLFVGYIKNRPSTRPTPFHKPHSTELAGLKNIVNGDERFYNNIFIARKKEIPVSTNPNDRRRTSYGLDIFASNELPMFVDGNVYLNGAKEFPAEKNTIISSDKIHIAELLQKENAFFLKINLPDLSGLETSLITTELLGKAVVPDAAYENADGSPLSIDTDFFGAARNRDNPTAGPFEAITSGRQEFKIWEK